MAISLSKQTAQKIVDTIKDVCGHDINYINTHGIIFASTNPARIGDYHEIGKNVIQTEKTIEITSDDSFYGTQKGVNIPFIYNREVIAAIGITGSPDEVRQYAVLAQKITSLILREQETDSFNYEKKNMLNYVIRSLVENTEINHDFLVEFLNELNLCIDTTCRTIIIQPNSRYNLSNLSLIENHIYRTFDQIGALLYTFNFPNEYILILPEEQYQKWAYIFDALNNNTGNVLHIGIGTMCALSKQYRSYKAAQIALRSLSASQNIAIFDDLDLEIVLSCVNEEARSEYLRKTVSSLTDEDMNLLRTYFSTNMSLKETSEILFLHKNTLQYKLNRIEKLTGYNPRVFSDAVNLFLAIKLSPLKQN